MDIISKNSHIVRNYGVEIIQVINYMYACIYTVNQKKNVAVYF